MRTRTPAALAIVGALALAACGSDDSSADDAAASPATTAAMSEDEMSETTDDMSDEMTETTDDMSDDEMTDDMSDDEMAAAEGDLLVVASGRDDLTTLVAAVEAAGLTSALTGDGPFTIFAPNDEAFEDYLGEMGMTAEDALADTEFLSTLLQGHVVEADIFATNGVIHVIDTVLAPV